MFRFTPYTSTMGLSGTSLQLAIGFIATCAFWLFGYDMSVMGGVVTEAPFLSVFPACADANTLGIVIASFEIGALFGALSCLDLGDRLGRRTTVWLGMSFMVVGGTLQTSAWSLPQLVVGRVISGFGLGLQVATVPSWQAECAKPRTQGRWVMIEGGLQTSGVACGQLIGWGFWYLTGQVQWRAPVGIQIAPALVVFVFINFLPESPRWLIKHGMFVEGTQVLCKLRGLSEDDPILIAERQSIIATFESQAGQAPFAYSELWSSGKTKIRYRVLIGFFMQAAQQLSGINLVSTYANKILQDSFDLSPGTSHLIAAMGGIEYAICSLISVLFIEGLGRRKSFLFTAAGMSICMMIIAGLMSTGNRKNQLVAAGFLFLFNTFFGLAWVAGPWLYSSEIAPLRARAQANAIATGGNWLFCFIVVMIVPPAFAHLGWRTYIIFAVFNAAFIPIIYFFMVETKGRSLEELDVVFAAGGNPVKKERDMPYGISVGDARDILQLDSVEQVSVTGAKKEADYVE